MTSQILAGKVAIITGAGRGLGKAFAKVFVREGAKVLVVDFSGAEKEVAAELGASTAAFHADVSKEDEIKAMFAAAIEKFGRVDALVNNAATQMGRRPGEPGDISVEEYDELTETNFRGLLMCCKHAVRVMKGGGSIINVSSVGGLNAEDRAPIVYMAAKSAVHSLTKAFALHYGPHGIRANALAPGFHFTEVMENMAPAQLEYMSEKAALKRPGRPEEAGEVAAFLASDRSSFVTGAIIPVDGGWSARMA